MRIHFISIGGSAMHNLAIALHKKGYQVSGSDDEIFEPSKSRLTKYNILPKQIGWDENIITKELDAVILGMHAKPDNPELQAAQAMGLKIYSYPEYVYEQSKNKKRIIVAGSHGKTSITSMVLHVLKHQKTDFDYLVGAQLEGFETMVRLSDAPIIVIEGDEYLSSPIDRKPKFLWYKPHVAVISGIAWDHINVFPTFENYVKQFELFLSSMEQNSTLIYYQGDEILKNLATKKSNELKLIPYNTHKHEIIKGKTILKAEKQNYEVYVFGDHNLQNLQAAYHICSEIAVSAEDFYQAIQTFKGASKRLECIAKSEKLIVFKDYAHSPSKLKATTAAVKKQFPDRKLTACMELHTFSSLNKQFLAEYAGSMSEADEAYVYYNPKTIAHKGLTPISANEVEQAFSPSKVKVFDQSQDITHALKSKEWNHSVLLLMTSGNFDGVNLNEFGESLIY
jgi:UDP-N-acetylmuramate: L-alanyl-gamma-D-glutamyl-meso-diaminopimelate ligase